MNRYKPVGNWREAPTEHCATWYGDVKYLRHVRLQISDVREVNGAIWHDGAHKVIITGPPGRPRSKTFIGETAWSDAERYIGDAVSWFAREDKGW